MTTEKPVKVYWYPMEERGRKAPPPGPRYIATYRSRSDEAEDWSVLLRLQPERDHKFVREGRLSFLSEVAPLAALTPGASFFLCEGHWPVAEGVVLQDDQSNLD